MGSAMYTAVTGLLGHQARMDVVAANIANVNTTGYRGSRMLFQDLLSTTLSGGTAPLGAFGGTDPSQVGLGLGIGQISTDYTQGPSLTTGVASDLLIQGSGFFILSNGSGNFFTRDGSFDLNSEGTLIDPGTGMRVQGWMADDTGVIDTDTPLTDLEIRLREDAIARATENVTAGGNLDASAEMGTADATVERTLIVYDSLGTPRNINITFTLVGAVDDGGTDYNAWTWRADFDGTDVTNVPSGEGVLLFDTDGAFHAEGSLDAGVFTERASLPSENEVSIPEALFTSGALPVTPFEFSVDFSSITQLAASGDEESTVFFPAQDGFELGVLDGFSIGANGVITGVFSNGLTRALGQIATSTFANVGGLERTGDNLFVEGPASGVALIGVAGSGGHGAITGGALEGANVDLATEFANMIITQRGYQANARTITTADTMLQEAVNLVR